MKTTTFSQFRNNAKKYFDAVGRGETVEIYRHGKPVALLSPIAHRSPDYWRKVKAINRGRISLTRVVLNERTKSR